MSHEDDVHTMLTGVPSVDRAVVIFPVGDQSGCRWVNMTPEQVVDLLYRVADQILEQKVPLRHKRLPGMDPGK